MEKRHITLTAGDKEKLSAMLSKGVVRSRCIPRIKALQLLDEGHNYNEVSKILDVCYPSVLAWANRYREEGLSSLEERARSGRPSKFNGSDAAKVTALACSTPPEGRSQWSLRLLADKLVELSLVETISDTTVGRILKKTNFSPTANVNGA
jgi:transposase